MKKDNLKFSFITNLEKNIEVAYIRRVIIPDAKGKVRCINTIIAVITVK